MRNTIMDRRNGGSLKLAATTSEAFNRLAPGNYHRIARNADLPVYQVSRILRGIRGARIETAERIAAAAGVSISDLLNYRKLQKAEKAA